MSLPSVSFSSKVLNNFTRWVLDSSSFQDKEFFSKSDMEGKGKKKKITNEKPLSKVKRNATK